MLNTLLRMAAVPNKAVICMLFVISGIPRFSKDSLRPFGIVPIEPTMIGIISVLAMFISVLAIFILSLVVIVAGHAFVKHEIPGFHELA